MQQLAPLRVCLERSLSTDGAITNGKPFHHPCPGSDSDGRNFGCKCSGQGVPKVQRSFGDDLREVTSL